jgi:hypothetical protein
MADPEALALRTRAARLRSSLAHLDRSKREIYGSFGIGIVGLATLNVWLWHLTGRASAFFAGMFVLALTSVAVLRWSIARMRRELESIERKLLGGRT